MRIIEKLAYNAIKVATLASVVGLITGVGTLVFANGTLLDLQENKDIIIEEYINSGEYHRDYIAYQNKLNKEVNSQTITPSESISKMNEYLNKDNIAQHLLNSNSLIGKSYQQAEEAYQEERKSLLTKTLVGLSCGIPALAGSIALDKINEKENSTLSK